MHIRQQRPLWSNTIDEARSMFWLNYRMFSNNLRVSRYRFCNTELGWALIHWSPTWITVFTKKITLLCHKCPQVYIFTNKLSCAINQFSPELKVWVWGAQWFAILLYVSSHQLIEADTAYKIKIKHLDLALEPVHVLFDFCSYVWTYG